MSTRTRRTLGRSLAQTSTSILGALSAPAPASKPGPAKAAAPPEAPAGTPTVKMGLAPLAAEERRRLIARVAYARAERARFSTDPFQDWLAAEREVDASLSRASA